MNDYDNTNRGAIWPARERKSDKHPHFKGEANIEGVEYWVSAWKKQEGDPAKAPSLKFSFQRKDDAHKEGVKKAKQAAASELDSDLPF